MSATATDFIRSELKFERGDLGRVAQYEPLADAMRAVRAVPGAFIAGGAVVSAISDSYGAKVRPSIKDIDIFFTKATPDACEVLKNYLVDSGYRLSGIQTKNCVDLVKVNKAPLQLINIGTYDSVEHILDGFDIVLCQLATDGKELWYNPQAMADLQTGVIDLHRPHHVVKSTYEHVLRYIDKGYSLTSNSLRKLAQAMHERPFQP